MPERQSPTGRPKQYCSRSCQQAANRQTHRSAAASRPRASQCDPVVRGILQEVFGQAQQLRDLLEDEGDQGAETVAVAVQMARRVEKLTAALVWRARDRQVAWGEVAQALHIHPETARKNYHRTGTPPEPLLPGQHSETARSAHLWDPDASVPPGRLSQILHAALSRSQLTQREVARQAGVSPSALSRLLSGQRLPQWQLLERIGHICQADTTLLLRAWEREKRLSLPPEDLAPPVTRPLTEAEQETIMQGHTVPFPPLHATVIPPQAPAVPLPPVIMPPKLTLTDGEPPKRSGGRRTPLGSHSVTQNEMTDLFTAPRAEVGFRLYEWRVRAAVSVLDAARAIGSDRSKISRMENGRAAFKERDVRILCKLYGTSEEEEASMLQDVETTNRPAWWDQFGDAMEARLHAYVTCEATSSIIRTAEPDLIPGLLQTQDYARAVMENYYGEFEDLDAETLHMATQRVKLRMERQKKFSGTDRDTKLWAVVPETEILRWRHRSDILGPQLDLLIKHADDPRYSLFLTPGDQWRRPAFSGAMTIFDFTGHRLSTVAYVEAADGATFQTDPTEVEKLKQHLDRLSAYSLSRAATRGRLRVLRQALRDGEL